MKGRVYFSSQLGLGQRRAALIIAGCFSADVTGNIWSTSEEKQRSRPRCLNNGEDFSCGAFPGNILLYIWPCHAACGELPAKLRLHWPAFPRRAISPWMLTHLLEKRRVKTGVRPETRLSRRCEPPTFPRLCCGSRPPTQPLGGILIPQRALHGIA